MNCTFVNTGTPYSFDVVKYVRHPSQNKGVTLLQLHAELALEAEEEGRKDIFLLDVDGSILSKNILKHCAKTGKFPEEK